MLQAIQAEMRAQLLDDADLEQFAVLGSEADFEAAAGPDGAALRPGGVLSVRAAPGAAAARAQVRGVGRAGTWLAGGPWRLFAEQLALCDGGLV
jgi:hypothetical protein